MLIILLFLSRYKAAYRENQSNSESTSAGASAITNSSENSSEPDASLSLEPKPKQRHGRLNSTPSLLSRSGTATYLKSEHSLSTDTFETMNFSCDLSLSDEYQSFRSSVSLRKIAIDSDSTKIWKLFEAGPKSVHTPLVCLAPVVGTADVFYRQILALSARGVRVISVECCVYWTVNDWCEGFKKLLDHLDIDKVHLFGASLGGFLAQKFAEYTSQYSRVTSLILCNSFNDTTIFNLNESAMVFWMLPSVVLKKMVIGNLSNSHHKDSKIVQAIDFMTERLNSLSQQDIASRLTINCTNSSVDAFKLRGVPTTIIDVFDESALSNQARDEFYRTYPTAKMAHLKSGGNFPYLSRSDEVNMHILIHLRSFSDTTVSAIAPTSAYPGPSQQNGH